MIKVLLGFAVLATLIYGCEKEEESSTPERLEVGITPFLDEAATFVAKEKGFFAEEGLRVELRRNEAGKHSIKQLADDQIDIAHVAETPLSYAFLDPTYLPGGKAEDVLVFADLMYTNVIQKVIARADMGIEKPGDIKNRKVGFYQGTQSDYHLSSFLLENQLSVEEINQQSLPPLQQLEAFRNGEIVAMVNWEPHATQALMEMPDKAHELRTQLTYSTLWLATAKDQFLENHPQVVKSYLKALRKAQKWIKANEEPAKEIVAYHTDSNVEVLDEIWDEIAYDLSLSERMLFLLDEQARWMYEENKIDDQTFDFAEKVKFEPMEEVYPEGITIIK